MAGVEIERKFLLDRLPDGLGEGERIDQGYLAVAEDGVEVRVRRRGEKHVITVKSGPARTRVEEEIPIDERRFDALWALTEGRRVSKTRHLIPVGEHTAEVDVYHGDHDGLCTAEIEFGDEGASDAFSPPEWLGREVTGDKAYAAQSLALHGMP
jgi:adenylate cyclase